MTSSTRKCPDCGGAGRPPCRHCRGEGEIICPRCNGFARLPENTPLGYRSCPDCNAFGRARCPFCVNGRSLAACTGCNGTGSFPA